MSVGHHSLASVPGAEAPYSNIDCGVVVVKWVVHALRCQLLSQCQHVPVCRGWTHNTIQTCTQTNIELSNQSQRRRTVQFSSVQFSSRWYLNARKAIIFMRFTHSLRSFPTWSLKQFQCSSDWRWIPLSSFQEGRLAFPLSASLWKILLSVCNGVVGRWGGGTS